MSSKRRNQSTDLQSKPNQLTGFYMMGIWAVNGLTNISVNVNKAVVITYFVKQTTFYPAFICWLFCNLLHLAVICLPFLNSLVASPGKTSLKSSLYALLPERISNVFLANLRNHLSWTFVNILLLKTLSWFGTNLIAAWLKLIIVNNQSN